ncbi:Brix domain-containing protein [Kalaharituber pfeilii]|nr:Brix domain-containing protein [Kalaharituber pfeilii]
MASENRVFKIPNKLARQKLNVKIKTSSGTAKHKLRAERRKEEEKNPELRVERLKKNIPITLERKRVWDERVDGAYSALAEKKRKVEEEKKAAETISESDSDNECVGRKPKGKASKDELSLEHRGEGEELVAEEAYEASQAAKAEAAETAKLYPTLPIHIHPTGAPPNSVRKGKNKAKQFSIPEICSFASSPPPDPKSGEAVPPFTHVAVINEHRKKPSGLTIIVLPSGPSFHFTMTNYLPSSAIHNHGRATSHTPELILNNFLTPLGKLAAGLFQSMFPPVPELGGRQVVTLHNQRDYIFFRRHRYMFRERRGGEKAVGYGIDHGQNTTNPVSEGVEDNDLGIKVGLQELGPQFTLKLRKVEKGVCEGVEWQWKGEMEKERRKFQL